MKHHDLHPIPNMESLYQCSVCGAAEGELPTACPGRLMTRQERDNVLAGYTDYREIYPGLTPEYYDWTIEKAYAKKKYHEGWNFTPDYLAGARTLDEFRRRYEQLWILAEKGTCFSYGVLKSLEQAKKQKSLIFLLTGITS